MIRCKNFSPRLPTFFLGGLTEGLVSQTLAINCFIMYQKVKPNPKTLLKPKLARGVHQLIDACRHLTKSARKPVQGWLAIRQKNTVVGGNFSYGY